MAWSWLLTWQTGRCRDRTAGWIISASQSLLLGVLISLFTTLFLAEIGLYSQLVELSILTVLTAGGITLGFYREPGRFRRHIAACLPGLLVFMTGVSVIMNLPRCGEWIVGGWDPGVYLNQGVYVERTGTFYPAPVNCYQSLTPEEMLSFTRGDEKYRECFTGIPIDPETGSFRHYFFRLTPSLVATVARTGGLRAAVRVNMIVGLMATLVFLGFLTANECRIPQAAFSTILLITQPLWLYHLHIPTSEMLQLFLLCGVGMLIPQRKKGFFALFLLALTVFAALINRLGFLPFSGLFLFLLSWLDHDREDRKRVLIERTVLVIAIAAGAAFDVFVTSITIARLENIIPTLMRVTMIFIILSVGLDLAAMNPGLRTRLSRSRSWLSPAFCTVIILGAGAVWFLDAFPLTRRISTNLHGIVPYIGWGLVLCSTVGALLLFSRNDWAGRCMRVFVLFLLCVTTILFVKTFIVGVYPWATRRHLAYTVPAVAILSGYTLSVLWELRGKYGAYWKVVAIVLLIAVSGTNAKKSWHAWNRTEYDGASEILARVADQIEDDDIVVADHPWWGTPLTFIYGKQVLNGKRFYAVKDTETMRKGLAALARLRSKGSRIRFLTSTPDGLNVFPLEIKPVTLDWTAEEVVLEEIIHSRNATDFETRRKRPVFRLYTWAP